VDLQGILQGIYRGFTGDSLLLASPKYEMSSPTFFNPERNVNLHQYDSIWNYHSNFLHSPFKKEKGERRKEKGVIRSN
jgi:hypothetical protein